MARTFSWLHLSDLHIGQKGQHLWPNFRQQFHDDVRFLFEENGPVHLVVFSGDLTQKGEIAEFGALSEELKRLWEVFAEFNSKPPLFAVPGNHDLMRPPEREAPVKLLNRWQEDAEVVRELFCGKENQYLSVIQRGFENYTKWYSELDIPVAQTSSGILPGDTSCVLDINEIKVGLVGLNSAYMQLSDGDYEGKLYISSQQLAAVTNNDASKWCEQNDFNLLVTHHPPGWFEPKALSNFNKDIYQPGRFVAHLYGHMHEASSQTYSYNGGLDRRSIQASSLFGLEHWGEGSENPRVHGYSLSKLEVDQISTNLITWPRIRMEGTHSDHIAPNHRFALIRKKEYFITPIQGQKESSTASSLITMQKVGLSAESESQNGAITLSNSLYKLLPSEHHLKIRTSEQQNCVDALSKHGIAWISADWGVGRDGFVWSSLKKLGREKFQVYRVELRQFDNKKSFLDNFVTEQNCSFQDYCRSLAIAGPTILLFDEAPAGAVDEVESLARIAKSYLTDTLIIIISRGLPKQSSIPSLSLGLLEEPDTRLYLEAQWASISEEITAYFVSQVQRKTEGLIARIDQLIRQLHVVNLDDIDPPELSAGRNVSVMSASTSLVQAIAELETSKNSMIERAFFLLQILALLPHGESVQVLKHIDPTRPLFADHTLLLYDRDLVVSKNVSALIGQNGSQVTSNKLMVIPPQVREYVLSRMDEGQIRKLVGLAADLYFGKSWREGKHKPAKITQIVTQETGGVSGNAHSLLLRMLGDSNLRSRPTFASAVLKLCVAYCTALDSASHYRRVEFVASEMLSLIPQEFELERTAIEKKLAKSLRMSGEPTRALELFELLLKKEKSTDARGNLLLNKALCLLALNDKAAITVAQEVVRLVPKSSDALQAKSISLEMQDEEANRPKLLDLERQSRRAGHSTVANNLTLRRVSNHTDPAAISTLRTVYESAVKACDSYNAHRAATKIARFEYLLYGEIQQKDLKRLIAAYHYFYGERFGSLFTNSHKALWDYFESQNEVTNQLILFRHSSFVWRLNGHEDIEKVYLKALETKKNEVLLSTRTIDKNLVYFISRSEYQGNSLEDQSGENAGLKCGHA